MRSPKAPQFRKGMETNLRTSQPGSQAARQPASSSGGESLTNYSLRNDRYAKEGKIEALLDNHTTTNLGEGGGGGGYRIADSIRIGLKWCNLDSLRY